MKKKKIDVTRLTDKVVEKIACDYDDFGDMPNDLQGLVILYVLSDGKSRNEFQLIEDIFRFLIDVNLEYLVRCNVLERNKKYKWNDNTITYKKKIDGVKVDLEKQNKERCFAWKIQ